jgi:ketosteroid isomerase-like protein
VPELIAGVAAEGTHPEIDVVRRAFHMLELGDVEQMLAIFADDFEGHPLSHDTPVVGQRGAREFLARASTDQNELEPTVFRFERNGRGQVGVFGRLRVRGPTGIVDTPAAWICWVEDGRIKRAVSFTSMAAAQRALHKAEA